MTIAQVRFILLMPALFAVPPMGQAAAAEPPTAADVRASRERPLFSPTRRPPPPPAPIAALAPTRAVAPPPSPPPSLTVSGIIVGGGRGTAIVRRAADASASRVTLGDQVDGWTVEEIRPRSIVLRRGDRTVTLELEAQR